MADMAFTVDDRVDITDVVCRLRKVRVSSGQGFLCENQDRVGGTGGWPDPAGAYEFRGTDPECAAKREG